MRAHNSCTPLTSIYTAAANVTGTNTHPYTVAQRPIKYTQHTHRSLHAHRANTQAHTNSKNTLLSGPPFSLVHPSLWSTLLSGPPCLTIFTIVRRARSERGQCYTHIPWALAIPLLSVVCGLSLSLSLYLPNSLLLMAHGTLHTH